MSDIIAVNACSDASLRSSPLSAELGIEIPPGVQIAPAEGFWGSMGYYEVTAGGKTETRHKDEIKEAFRPCTTRTWTRPGEIADALTRGGYNSLLKDLNERGIQYEFRKGSGSFYDAKANRMVLDADASAAEQAEALVFETGKLKIDEHKRAVARELGQRDYAKADYRTNGHADPELAHRYEPQTRAEYVKERLATVASAADAAARFRETLAANGGPAADAGRRGIADAFRRDRLLTGDTHERYADVYDREWSHMEVERAGKSGAASGKGGAAGQAGTAGPGRGDAGRTGRATAGSPSAGSPPSAASPPAAKTPAAGKSAVAPSVADRIRVAEDFLDLVERRHHYGLDLVLGPKDRYDDHVVAALVRLGEDPDAPCREDLTPEAFDRGAAAFAKTMGIESQYSAAVRRGEAAREAQNDGQLRLYGDVWYGSVATAKQHEEGEWKRSLERLRAFDAWVQVVGSMGFGAPGEGPAPHESGTGRAAIEPPAIAERAAPREPMPAPDPARSTPRPKPMGTDPSNVRVVANASDGMGRNFQVVAPGQPDTPRTGPPRGPEGLSADQPVTPVVDVARPPPRGPAIEPKPGTEPNAGAKPKPGANPKAPAPPKTVVTEFGDHHEVEATLKRDGTIELRSDTGHTATIASLADDNLGGRLATDLKISKAQANEVLHDVRAAAEPRLFIGMAQQKGDPLQYLLSVFNAGLESRWYSDAFDTPQGEGTRHQARHPGENRTEALRLSPWGLVFLEDKSTPFRSTPSKTARGTMEYYFPKYPGGPRGGGANTWPRAVVRLNEAGEIVEIAAYRMHGATEQERLDNLLELFAQHGWKVRLER